jgi:RHS repeat-associated protein
LRDCARLQQQDSRDAVAYLYDLDGHLIAEATASTGATTRDYIWLAANDNTPVDMPLAVVDGGTTLSMAHTDHLGRPIKLTSATKAVVFTAIYKPYGEVYSTSATVASNLRFPGQYFLIETGFAYNWHRHYDPIIGRYTQPDPLRFVDGPSIYSYVGSSPLIKTDSQGLFTVGKPGGGNLPHSMPPNAGEQQCASKRENCHDACWGLVQLMKTFDRHGHYLQCMARRMGTDFD